MSGQVHGRALIPVAMIPDVLVGGVNADHSVHGRDLEEEEERRGRRGVIFRMVNTLILGAEMALSTTRGQSVSLQYDNGR